MDFTAFPKIPRLSRECIITEKIDGTNASIYISDNLDEFKVASRTKWLEQGEDNHGFRAWAITHKDELITGLGPGHHFGEWWGSKIQRGYGLSKGDKRFSLFNTSRWAAGNIPACVSVVPVLYMGPFDTNAAQQCIERLQAEGSVAAPGFKPAEGIVIFHVAGNLMFKKTCERDEQRKSEQRDENGYSTHQQQSDPATKHPHSALRGK